MTKADSHIWSVVQSYLLSQFLEWLLQFFDKFMIIHYQSKEFLTYFTKVQVSANEIPI